MGAGTMTEIMTVRADFLHNVRLRTITESLVRLYDKEIDKMNRDEEPDRHHSYCTDKAMIPVAMEVMKLLDIAYAMGDV